MLNANTFAVPATPEAMDNDTMVYQPSTGSQSRVQTPSGATLAAGATSLQVFDSSGFSSTGELHVGTFESESGSTASGEQVIVLQGDQAELTAEELEKFDVSFEVIETHNADGSVSITKLKKKKLKYKKPKRKIRAAINGVGNERARELLYAFRDTHSDFLDAFTDENIENLVNFLDIVPFMVS